jgi:ribosomal protein L11 methyltransferase
LKWLEVSLHLDGELAEAVAELLARHCIDGVSIESTQIEAASGDAGRPIGALHVRGFLSAGPGLERQKKKLELGLWHLSQIMPLPEPSYRWLEQEDWAETWKAGYQPLPVGRSLIIVPAWMGVPESNRTPIMIDPGMAFGTGTHPSTRLCLAILEDHLKPGDVVLDVGTGSGILSIASVQLGARRVFALDIDQDAVDAAAENVARNGLSDRIEIDLGSLAEAKQLMAPEAPNLLLANLLAPILEDLLQEGLASLAPPGAILILSGILEDQCEPLIERTREANLTLLETRREQDWHALVLEIERPPRA